MKNRLYGLESIYRVENDLCVMINNETFQQQHKVVDITNTKEIYNKYYLNI